MALKTLATLDMASRLRTHTTLTVTLHALRPRVDTAMGQIIGHRFGRTFTGAEHKQQHNHGNNQEKHQIASARFPCQFLLITHLDPHTAIQR